MRQTYQHNPRADRLVPDETRPRDRGEEDPAQVSELLGSSWPSFSNSAEKAGRGVNAAAEEYPKQARVATTAISRCD